MFIHVLTGNKGSRGKKETSCHYVFAQDLGFLLIFFTKVYSGVLFGEAFLSLPYALPGQADCLVQEPGGAVRRQEEGAGWVSGPSN